MSASFCLPHPVAVSAFMICRGLCACTEMLWMCVLDVSFGSKKEHRCYIVRLLPGSRMVSHLSGSHFLISGGFLLGCDQTGSEPLMPSVWFVPF